MAAQTASYHSIGSTESILL